MNIQYRIYGVDTAFGSIQVNYYDTDLAPKGFTYQIDIPLDAEGIPLTGDALNAEINSRTPVWMFQRIEALKGADFSHVEALVVPDPNAPVIPAAATKPQPATNATTV